MPTRYVLGRERGGSTTMKPTATRTWLACPGSTRGEEGVPFGEQAPGPTWYRLCVQPQLHTLGSATPLPQTFQNPLQVSNHMCKSSVHVLFKTLLNFWWRWGFLPATACRRAGLGSQSCPGSPSLLLATQGVRVALPGPCMTWCLQTSWASRLTA